MTAIVVDSSALVAVVLREASALNFGDCLSYAVARVEHRPLRCVGNDFALTDLTLA